MSGGTLHALTRLGLRHIPFGAGNIQGLMPAAQFLKSTVPRFWPSDGLYLGGRAAERGIDAVIGSVDRMLLAGEPGVGEPAMRARLEAAWGARVADALGIEFLPFGTLPRSDHKSKPIDWPGAS